MVSASWLFRKSSNRSACEPRAPRWTSEINKVRNRRSGNSSLIEPLPMREQVTESHDGLMTRPGTVFRSRSGWLMHHPVAPSRERITRPRAQSRITAQCDRRATSRQRDCVKDAAIADWRRSSRSIAWKLFTAESEAAGQRPCTGLEESAEIKNLCQGECPNHQPKQC